MASIFDDPQGQDFQNQDNYAPSDFGGSPYKAGLMDLPQPAFNRFNTGGTDFGQTFRGSPQQDYSGEGPAAEGFNPYGNGRFSLDTSGQYNSLFDSARQQQQQQNQTFNNPSGYYPANPQQTQFDNRANWTPDTYWGGTYDPSVGYKSGMSLDDYRKQAELTPDYVPPGVDPGQLARYRSLPQFQQALENTRMPHPGWNFGEAGPPGSPDFVRHPQNQQDWQKRYSYFQQNPEQAMPDWKPVNQFYQQNDPNAVNYLRQLMSGQQQYRYMTPQGAQQQLQAWGYLPPPTPARPVYSGGGYAPRTSYSSYAPRPATSYTAPRYTAPAATTLPAPTRNVQTGANAILQAANTIQPGVVQDMMDRIRAARMSQLGQSYYNSGKQ